MPETIISAVADFYQHNHSVFAYPHRKFLHTGCRVAISIKAKDKTGLTGML